MRVKNCLGVIILCLALFPASDGFAQHCQPYWTAAYKCMMGCGCPGSGGPVPQPAAPSPEVLAFQRVRPRMIAVIQAISASLPMFDRDSWMADLPNTQEQFISKADRLHVALVGQSTALNRQVAAYRDIIDFGTHYTPTLMQEATAAQRDIDRLTSKLKEAQGYLPWYRAQINNLDRATSQIRAQSARYLARIGADQKTVVAAFAVLLPAGAAISDDNLIVEPPQQRKTREPNEPVFALRQSNGRSLYPNLPPPLLREMPDTNAQPAYAEVPKLGGSLDDRAAHLEEDARNARSSFEQRNEWMARAQPARQAYKDAGDRLSGLVVEQNKLVNQIFEAAGLADKARSAEIAAVDAMHTEEARFLAYAAQSWIWANTKKVVLENIKAELKMQDYFKRHTDIAHSPFLDIDEAHVLQYYRDRRFNVMNLPDGIEQAAGLRKLHNSIVTLLTHGEGYALEATTIAARGTESEAREFVSGVYAGMDADSKSIVKANMGAIDLPEPFASIATNYFTKTDP